MQRTMHRRRGASPPNNPATPGAITRRILGVAFATLTALTLLVSETAEAQYFGRNKVMYDDFDFHILQTEHFDIHHYGEAAGPAARDFGSMAERWYERLARTFQHDFEVRKPLIAYHNAPDFQQTNVIPGFISQATGGVTESVKNRVVLPFAASYAETDHVLGHELVHAFQYDLAQAGRGGGQTAIGRARLWLVEGMAEYLSLGRQSNHTAMWMRDAVLRDDLPSIGDLSNAAEYFPYRYGHALWAYIAGRWGDEIVADFYLGVGGGGVRGAAARVLGIHPDTLSADWRRATREHFEPLITGRSAPRDVGELILGADDDGGLTLAPELSPDGNQVMVLSQQSPFTLGLFVVDARTGEAPAMSRADRGYSHSIRSGSVT